MKKHISGSGESYGIVFAGLVLFFMAAYSIINDNLLNFVVFASATVLLIISACIFIRKSRADFSEYIKMITETREGMSGDAISKFPLPMAVLQIDGQISWFNDLFAEMVGTGELYNVIISEIMPELRWSEILKSKGSIYTYASPR